MPGLPNSTKTSSPSTSDVNFPEIMATSELWQQPPLEEKEEGNIPLALAAVRTVMFQVSVDGEGTATATTMTAEMDKNHEEEESCVTPKSEEYVLKFSLTCPPAPRKPRTVAKRKFNIPAKNLFVLPVDLASVFRALPCDPPKKKIHTMKSE